MKRYRDWSPRQSFLLPPSPMDWLPDGHLALFILDVVGELDLSEIEEEIQRKDGRGTRPYPPQMMVALVLYAYCVGVFSSRKIARATHEDVAFRVLAGGEHPHFTTINDFRLNHRDAFKALFVQVLRLCQRAGMVKLGHVSLDGSKVQANASKHKAMSYERMTQDEKHLEKEIDELLDRARRTDEEDDARFGRGEDEEDLPGELARRQTRLQRIREAKAALEEEAKAVRAAELRELAAQQRDKADDKCVDPVERKRASTRAKKSEDAAARLDPPKGGSDDDEDAPSEPVELPSHRVPTTADGKPKGKAQRNFTDPDSRIMKNNRGYLQGYNAHIAVDAEHQVIVAEAVTNQPPDQEHLPPMVDLTINNCGAVPEKVSADNGFLSAQNVAVLESHGIDAYVAVGRKIDQAPEVPPDTASSQVRERMRQKLQTPEGKAIYARRKVIAEPPFGQIKGARGFRSFSLRGLTKVRAEWTLVSLTHNLLKLFRIVGSPGPPSPHPAPG